MAQQTQLQAKLLNLAATVALIVSVSASLRAQTNRSVYTSLDPKQCKNVRTVESGDYEGRCPGVAGYSLLVVEGDLRQNITVITPQKKQHSLELWNVVSSAFSSLGPRAEWRVTKKGAKVVPHALIVRYNASEDVEHPDKLTSYLAVAKITSTSICVIEKIPPAANANEMARVAADSASDKPCLQRQP